MAFLALYMTTNLYMASLAWRAYGRLLTNRGQAFSWSFQNTVNLFLVWAFVTGCFEIAFAHSHDPAIFIAYSAQLIVFIGLIKIGTMDYDFCRTKTAQPTGA